MVGYETLLVFFHFGFKFWPVCFTKKQDIAWFLFMLGSFNSVLTKTRSWSPRPGEDLTSVKRVGFVVRNRSKMLSCHVGSETTCVKLYSCIRFKKS